MADEDFGGLADDFDEVDDFDHGHDGEETGQAAVLCTLATTGVGIIFFTTIEDAVRHAEWRPCDNTGCIGVHSIAQRDARGELHVVPAADDHQPPGRRDD